MLEMIFCLIHVYFYKVYMAICAKILYMAILLYMSTFIKFIHGGGVSLIAAKNFTPIFIVRIKSSQTSYFMHFVHDFPPTEDKIIV